MDSLLTVITPATTHDLTTLATVKAELGISTTAEDTNLNSWIDQASSVIAGECNTVFGSEAVKETFRVKVESGGYSYGYYGSGGNFRNEPFKITLRRRPVTVFTSIIENSTTTLVEDTDYECDKESGIITRLCNDYERRWCFRKLAVTYTAGWVLGTTLPNALERAAISLVKQYRYAATRDPMLKSEDIPGVLNQTFWVGSTGEKSQGLPPDVEMLIAPYRDNLVP